MSFRMVPKSVTLNYLERRNSPFAFEAHCVKVVEDVVKEVHVRYLIS